MLFRRRIIVERHLLLMIALFCALGAGFFLYFNRVQKEEAHFSEQRMSKRLRRSPSKAARRGGSISKEDEEGEDNEDMGGTIGGRYYPRNGKRASLLPRTLRPPKRIDQAAFAGSSHESLPKPRSWILRVMVLRPMPSATAASIRRPPV